MAIIFEVPTNVLIEQGRAIRGGLRATENQPGRAALSAVQFDVDGFLTKLDAAIGEGEQAEAEQERAKANVSREEGEDRQVAEEGFRWIQRLQSRVRRYVATNDDNEAPEDLAQVFRFGQLRNARPRGVVYELRILLPEAEEHQARLAPFGVTKEFVGEGRTWQAKLDTERDETTAAKAARKALTRRVRASERTLSGLLRQLEAADETVALERPEAKRWFPLSVINAEQGRVRAAREARVAARAAEDPGPDTKDE